MSKTYYIRAENYQSAVTKAKRIAKRDSFGELENNRDWDTLTVLIGGLTDIQNDLDRQRIQVDTMNTEQGELFNTLSDISDLLETAIEQAKRAKKEVEASFDHEKGGDDNAERKPNPNPESDTDEDLDEPDEDVSEEE